MINYLFIYFSEVNQVEVLLKLKLFFKVDLVRNAAKHTTKLIFASTATIIRQICSKLPNHVIKSECTLI